MGVDRYKGRAKAKLHRRQGWAGATADTEGATWTPTPWPRPSLHFVLALNRPFRSLPGIARPGPGSLRLSVSLDTGYRSFTRLSCPAVDRQSCGRASCWPASSRLLPSRSWELPAHLIPAAIMRAPARWTRPLCHGVPICTGRKHQRPRVAAGLAPPRWRCAGALSCAHGT